MDGAICAGILVRSGIRRTILAVSIESDRPLSDTSTFSVASGAMGTFDEEGNYQPRQVVDDDLGMSFADAIEGTMVEVEDGQLVFGSVVKIDKDEVLLDIGYKSEGVILARELSIRNDVNPHEIVKLGEKVEALVLQKEDKEGRLLLSKKRAQYERAWGTIEKIKEADGMVEGPVIEVVKGGLIVDIGLRGFLPASLVELRRVRDLAPYIGKTVQAKIIELDKNRNNVVLSRRASSKRRRRNRATASSPTSSRARSARVCVERRQLRCVRRPRWHGRSHPRQRAVVEARRSSGCGRRRRRSRHRAGARRRLRTRAHQPVAEGNAAGSVAGVRQHARGRSAGLRPGYQARAVRWVRAGRRRHRGSRPHLGDEHASRRGTRAGRHTGRGAVGQDHRPRPCPRRISLSIKQAAEGGELAEEYRQHFEIDEHGNWTAGGDDAEREAAWAEYYENNPDATPGEAEAASEAARCRRFRRCSATADDEPAESADA
jgi:small subunit ribosomal protein S1